MLINVKNMLRRPVRLFENGFGILWYGLLAVLPVLSVVLRLFGAKDIPYLSQLLFHFVVMLTAVAGSYTERFSEHLSLDLGVEKRSEKWAVFLVLSRDLLGSFLLMLFVLGSIEMLFLAFLDEQILGIPIQFFVAFIPIGILGIMFHRLRRIGNGKHLWLHLAATLFGFFISYPSILNLAYSVFANVPEFFFALDKFWYEVVPLVVPILVVLVILFIPAGLPLYLGLGGIAALLFVSTGFGSSIVLYEGYSSMNNTAIPSIALFTLTGFLLSEGRASKRIIEVFLAVFGWFPGGLVVAAVIISIVFTIFTGASGVTILALGGLLFGVLKNGSRYSDNFITGLLTSSGSIGLLFPPSMAIILYGSVAQINIKHVFAAGIIPGILLATAMIAFGIVMSIKSNNKPVPFEKNTALRSFKDAIWELLIPVVTLGVYFSGQATLLETAAITLIYTLIVEILIKKDFNFKQLRSVVASSMRIIGGVLIILFFANGLKAYIVDAQIPQILADYVSANVSSKIVFLLLLNLALLITGAIMDIYSAIAVVVPLILPLGQIFGIHPLHLGIIFLANLELGFMTPPVGLNLFLSSYRFGIPLPAVYRSIIPFLLLQVVVVLIITFVPGLSLAFVPR